MLEKECMAYMEEHNLRNFRTHPQAEVREAERTYHASPVEQELEAVLRVRENRNPGEHLEGARSLHGGGDDGDRQEEEDREDLEDLEGN